MKTPPGSKKSKHRDKSKDKDGKQQHPPPSSGLNSTTSRPQLPSKLPKEEEEEVGGKDAAEDSNAQGEPGVEAENHTGEDEEKEVCPVTAKVLQLLCSHFFGRASRTRPPWGRRGSSE